MSRTLDAVLEQLHRRANPQTCDIVEISAPDKALVLRRASDQFFSTPPRVSEAPAASSQADSAGALTLKAIASQVASCYADSGGDDIGQLDPTTQLAGLQWIPDATFGRAILRTFTARIRREYANTFDLQLQIYRVAVVWTTDARYRYASGEPIPLPGYAFLPMLAEPLVVKQAKVTWVANDADVIFDLSRYRIEVRPGPGVDPINGWDPNNFRTGEFAGYLFCVNPVNPSRSNLFQWRHDSASARTIAGVGLFESRAWDHDPNVGPSIGWGLHANAYARMFKLEVESYAVSSTIVYAIDLGGAPAAASTGRIVFERAVPPGTTATLELSTAGSGGPWTAVKHGDVLAVRQQTYHLRLAMTPELAARTTPRISQLGIEFRTPVDVSAEVVMEPITHQVEMPFGAAAIGEGRATVIRAGRRDYRDVASELAIGYAATKLEVDHYLGSRQVNGTRDRWFLIDRAPVNNREPTQGAEAFHLLSALRALKKKIPARAETVSSVHTIVAATTAQLQVTPNLSGISGTGSYAGKNYYLRVRSSIQAGIGSGYIQTIDNNTNADKLDFTTALPGTLIAGDIVEVHSAQFLQPTRVWRDKDPADIWWEILTSDLVIPPEKIGLGAAGAASRSGLPPKVTDRAPGDVTTQAKLLVSMQLKEAEEADKLIDQLSFLMGGVTVSIAGQICFRQIYPLRDADGTIQVSAGASVRTFDPRDYLDLSTPANVEQRITVLACDYGVDATAVGDNTPPANTVNYVDADALAYLATQDVEGLGRSVVDKAIARWCYNSADAGLFLATQIARQVVNACSTGLRLWPWTAAEAHPDLMIGDVVTVITDGYTDYDPTRGIKLRGWLALNLVIVSVAAGGRRFAGFMLGLGAAAKVQGGPGTLTAGDPDDPSSALKNFRFTDSSDGTTRTFRAVCGAFVTRVFVFDRLVIAPPTTDPWPAPGLMPDDFLTPDPVTHEIVYTAAKPANGYQRFIQFEPRRADLLAGEVKRNIIDPTPASMAPKITATITNNVADLSIDVVAGPGDWPIQVDVYQDDPLSAPFYTGSYSANTTLDKTSPGASVLGGISLALRKFRRWWVKLTNVAGAVSWAAVSSDRSAIPGLESFSLVWDEASGNLRARTKGGENCVSALIEVSTSPTFTSPTTATISIADGGDVSSTFALTFAQRGRTWYARATPYNAAALGGTAGAPLVAETTVPVVAIGGQEIPQGVIAIDAAGVPTAIVDGPLWVGSYKYATSTSSQPSDASALAGTLSNGRLLSVTGSALALAATFYITMIPFSAASAADYQGPSIRLRATRHDFTATKTVWFNASGFTPDTHFANPANYYDIDKFFGFTNGYLTLFGGYAAPDPVWSQVDFFDNLEIPDGATLTSVAADLYTNTNGARIKVELFRVASDGARTSLGSATSTTHGTSWETKTISISEATSGRRYQLYVFMDSNIGGNLLPDCRCSGYAVTYTIPSSNVGV